MEKTKDISCVFQVECPCCQAYLWVDPVTQEVIKSEKAKRKKGTLDDLLMKEKKKKEEADRRFMATAELAKERQQKAEEKFKKAFSRADED
jgi:hypothetical protein